MASSQSIKRGQFPITCQLCETGGKIQWRCIDCELLMCQRCYDKIHPKFKNAKDHTIENINQVGKKPAISNIQLMISRQFVTDLKVVHYMCACSDGSVWITDNLTSVLCRVKLDGGNLGVLNKFDDMRIYGIASTPSNVFFSEYDSKLKEFNETTGQITESKYSVSPLLPKAIYITSDNKIIVGAAADYDGPRMIFPFTGRRAIIIMDMEGRQITIYEHDKNKENILSYPERIICTLNGNIFVVDRLSQDNKCRIVVIRHDGDVLRTYKGHPDINTETKPFKAVDMIVSPSSDSVIVCESYTRTLHVLDNSGNIVTTYNTRNVGIELPYSLAFTSTGKLLIGCSIKSAGGSGKASLYETEYTEH